MFGLRACGGGCAGFGPWGGWGQVWRVRDLRLPRATMKIPALTAALAALLSATILPAATPVREARPALWKLADADTTIYLFGTIHALPDGVEWRGRRIDAAL